MGILSNVIGGITGKICAIVVKEILDFMIEKCLNKKISKVQKNNCNVRLKKKEKYCIV